MKEGIIYIAGPLSGDMDKNRRNAAKIAYLLRGGGRVCIVPHLESIYNEDTMDEENWLEHGCRLLSKCNVMVVLPGWANSKGTKAEIVYANDHGIPIVYLMGYEEEYIGAMLNQLYRLMP